MEVTQEVQLMIAVLMAAAVVSVLVKLQQLKVKLQSMAPLLLLRMMSSLYPEITVVIVDM